PAGCARAPDLRWRQYGSPTASASYHAEATGLRAAARERWGLKPWTPTSLSIFRHIESSQEMDEVMRTEQRVAVVTGASQGIGAALGQAFRNRNYKVVATSRSIKPVADSDIATVPGDGADPKTADLVFKQALDRFDRVDTLVNNAGIFMAKPFTAYSN